MASDSIDNSELLDSNSHLDSSEKSEDNHKSHDTFDDDDEDKKVDQAYHLIAEQAVGLEKSYILDMSVKQASDSINFAVALSNKSCMVYALTKNQFSLWTSLQDHDKPITNVRFSPKSEQTIYTSSLDGKIRIWDLRRQNCVKELKDDSGLKPLTCFDVSCDDRYICAGTELVGGDAFILFWDIRSRKLLGGYWESHTDDLTQIVFHPEKGDLVATGSTDGLINIFDIKESNEDEALQHSLNTESSVAKVRWHKNDHLSCITHTEVVQLWSVDGAGPELQFSREQVADELKRPNSDDCYLIDVHQKSNDDLFLLAGSTFGKGECLKLLEIEKDNSLSSVDFIGNRQIVRTSSYDQENNALFTAGETGCICVWKEGKSFDHRSGLKKVSKLRNKHKPKPY